MGVALPVPVQNDESPSLQILGASRCETWTLTRDLRWKLNSFDTSSLWRILGSYWSDFLFNERFLRETQMRFVTCIVHEHQLRLYEHVACFPNADPAHQILRAREPREWRRPMGQTRAKWLQQVDQHLKEMGMGKPCAWGWLVRGPWSTGGKWMQRQPAPAPIPDLTW